MNGFPHTPRVSYVTEFYFNSWILYFDKKKILIIEKNYIFGLKNQEYLFTSLLGSFIDQDKSFQLV